MSKPTYSLEGLADIGIQGINKAIAQWSLNTVQSARHGSLVEATQTMRVQPLCVIDHTLSTSPILEPLNQNLLNLFSAYYLQAVARDNVVGKVSVFRRLDKLNPNRSKAESVLNNAAIILNGMEGYYDTSLPCLPKLTNTHVEREAIKGATESLVYSMEALPKRRPVTRKEAVDYVLAEVAKQNPELEGSEVATRVAAGRGYQDRIAELEKNGIPYDEDAEIRANQNGWQRIGQSIVVGAVNSNKSAVDVKDAVKEVKELTHLAVGKILNVTFKEGDNSLTVPVAVRLMTSLMLPNALVRLLNFGSRERDLTLKERWHAYKSGKIEFWRDFILAKDLKKQRVNDIVADKDRIYQKIQARLLDNAAAGAMSANPSLANMSNIIVINKPTLQELESVLGGKFSNFNLRERVFNNTGIMLFAVVDNDSQRVKIYHQSIEECTDVSFNEINRGSKKDSDITDLLNVFLQGGAPRL